MGVGKCGIMEQRVKRYVLQQLIFLYYKSKYIHFRVEVDCRDIFKTGQLGVAMSRARSSEGLRVINFHPRYIIHPPAAVHEFMNLRNEDILEDMSCCRLKW